jgi:hypothetical protein
MHEAFAASCVGRRERGKYLNQEETPQQQRTTSLTAGAYVMDWQYLTASLRASPSSATRHYHREVSGCCAQLPELRGRTLLLEFIGGEPSEMLRDQFA